MKKFYFLVCGYYTVKLNDFYKNSITEKVDLYGQEGLLNHCEVHCIEISSDDNETELELYKRLGQALKDSFEAKTGRAHENGEVSDRFITSAVPMPVPQN
ncbi:MAG: hypothetical protein NT068_02700 [Candidatus Nomurabacteria bacterium]|nr:hypothetical protein [Candidatus Nomurabacteria bacterium]